MRVGTLLLALAIPACESHRAPAQATSTPYPCGHGNSILDSWECPGHKFFLGLVVSDKAGGFRVSSMRGDYPNEIEEPKHHLRGRVDYDGARITEVHGDKAGHFIIPLVSQGDRYALRWAFDGEFDTYEGIGPLRPRTRGDRGKYLLQQNRYFSGP